MRARISAGGGVLLEVSQNGIVDFFSRAEGSPKRDDYCQGAESKYPCERSQPGSHANRKMGRGTTPAVEHYAEKASRERTQSERQEDHQDNRRQHRDSSRGQSLGPIERGRQ